ncbi:unnamed protein product, partial [Mesorhabditis spiculigera]
MLQTIFLVFLYLCLSTNAQFSHGSYGMLNGAPTGFNGPNSGSFSSSNGLSGFDGPPTFFVPFGFLGISQLYFSGQTNGMADYEDFGSDDYLKFDGKPSQPLGFDNNYQDISGPAAEFNGQQPGPNGFNGFGFGSAGSSNNK